MNLALSLASLLVLGGTDARAADSHYTVVVSDLHLGGDPPEAGETWSAFEDFRWKADLEAFLDHIGTRADKANWPIDLVIAGDMFELWQSSESGSCPALDPGLGCSDSEATIRLARILALHQAELALLGNFAAKPGHRLVILPGNHDVALLLPGPRATLLSAFQAIPGANVIVDDDGAWLNADGAMLVEHGHQSDPANRFPTWPKPWQSDTNGVVRLERPWGEWFVLDLFDGLEKRWPTVDNTTDDVAVAKWLWGEVTWSERAATAWTLLGIGKTTEQKRDIANIQGSGIPWDFAAIRSAGDPLLWKLADPTARPPTPPSGDTLTRTLTDGDLAALCGRALERAPDQPPICPVVSGSVASKLSDTVTGASARRMGEYLTRRAKDLSLTSPYAYVYGHTHAALDKIAAIDAPFQLVINDGAFQRVVSVEELRARAGDGSPPIGLGTMTPEALPTCYSFVETLPYASGTPSPKGRYWHRDAAGNWKQSSYASRPAGCPRG
ncbi:MAG: metallophosphoesterase [Pseudomonadota bacterium]|nr:metallophosphoesterase [Pseudomonadota bacterium]